MRRADRLFRIVERLRRRRPADHERSAAGITAAALAEELEVSPRTIYRDVQDLLASGVPIQGEAGIGYVMQRGFDLPPLMFTEDEIEALVLGARVVQSYGDPELARAADSVLAKVEMVLPDRLRARVGTTQIFAPNLRGPSGAPALGTLRAAIRARKRVRFRYQDLAGKATAREIRPLCVAFWGKVWSVGAWCELRKDFRSFRIDRMEDVQLTSTFPEEPGKSLDDFIQAVSRDHQRAQAG